ncbi:major facilitator superfamily domain-containing protein [Leucosporidium creatinivorum]|uniref:Major facilitator superfamily domain-containing protein n=1 Tax=Leucosporidium creatinivorum TaxID=106004 RepID=A0A1Y2FY91_9BASI|nr:major facilitator superfamily domain-containing protein [Leucosporidium creatinivorum]
MSANFSTLERTISHGVVQHPIPSGDEAIFPQLTEAGPHTDAFQQETNTGLVLASEVEPHSSSGSPTSTLVHSAKDPEKGGVDAKLVTFVEGDPSNPRNFSKTKKWTATLLATLLCFDSGFASSIITGGLTPMRQQFNVSADVINLSVCLFVVGFGVGPLFFAPLSEMYGRRVIYLISMAFFFVFTIPCAVAQNVETLIICRFFAGLGASAPMTNAGGTIGDVWAVNERGNKMATFSSILFASPCLGPLVGGYIAESVSWRWIYWVLLIFSGFCWLVAFAFLPETYAPTILRWRAEQLRKETGDDTIQTEQERQRRSAADIAKESLLRPLQMLFTEPIMICFSGYLCLIYGLLYAFFFAYPIVFEEGHGFSYGQVGLTFLSILVGIVLVGAFACPLQERYYQRKIVEGGGSTVPETRLPLMMICSLLLRESA